MTEAKSNKKILQFYTIPATFVDNDYGFISKKYRIEQFQFRPSKKIYTPFVYLKQFFFLVSRLFSADAYICFFGSHHSLLPALFGKIFGKPCMIILGGADCVSFPSINYGNFNNPALAKVSRLAYKMATIMLPVHETLVGYDYTYEDEDFPRQGYTAFCKDIKTPYEVIDYGFDPEKWYSTSEKIPNSFITVASWLENPYRAKLKGVDLILEAANSFPDAHFTIVGFPDNTPLPGNPKNVTTYHWVDNNKMQALYDKHEFYIQISMSEGFPNAICEAMECNCIPIGSNVAAIPEIIGDTGFILYKRDIEKFKALLNEAMQSDKKTLAKKARERIMTKYPKDLREKKLMALLENLLENKSHSKLASQVFYDPNHL